MPDFVHTFKEEREDREDERESVDDGLIAASARAGIAAHPDAHNTLPRVAPLEKDFDVDTTPVEEEDTHAGPDGKVGRKEDEDASLLLDEYEDTDTSLTHRERHRDVVALAWPSVTTMLLQTFNGMMDTLFVGHLPNGKAALAATGVGGQVIFLLISLAMGVSVGTTALVSRFTGADEPEDAVRATAQSITLAVLLATVFGIGFYLTRGMIVGAMLGSEGGAASKSLCISFLSMAMLATIPLFVMNVLMAAFRGLGDTRTPLYVQMAVIATHISCNWLFIYGHWGAPHLGVAGAGLAFALSLFVGVTLYIVALLKRSTLGGALTLPQLRFRLEWAKRILKIGIPASIQAVVRNLAMMSFTGMLARTADGAAGVAAMQIGVRAEAIAFMPGFGYSVAASTLVGQALGAKNPKRAEQYGWAATVQGIAVMIVMAAVFFIFASPITSLFNSDPQVHKLGVDYLRVNAWCEPFLALGMVLTGALQGAGDTVRPTYITFFTMWIVRLPLAYLLMFTLGLQAHGAWVSMVITTVIGGMMTFFLFKSGKWKKIKV